MGKETCLGCDVGDDAQAVAMVDSTVAHLGRLDAAFNNAGVMAHIAPTADSTREEWDRVIGINLRGVWRCMKYELRHMVRQGSGAKSRGGCRACSYLTGKDVGQPRVVHARWNDEHWRDHLLFYEYFHGDTGEGIGASHQTGWTGVIAFLMQGFSAVETEKVLEKGMGAVTEVSAEVTKEAAQPGAVQVAQEMHEELAEKVVAQVVEAVQQQVTQTIQSELGEKLHEKVEEMVMEKVAEAVQKKAEEVQQQKEQGTEEKKDVL